MQMRSLLLILLTAGAAVAIDDMSGQPAHARASFSKICTHPVNVSEGVVVAENRCKFVSPKVRIRDHFSEFELLTDGKTARLFCRIAGFRRAVEWPEKSAPSFATMVRLEDRPMKLIDPGEKGHPVFDWIVCRN
jgi:hypothetical protein